jgi:hypothetical protein
MKIDFEEKTYEAGDPEQAYRADAFVLPDGRAIVAEWTETSPPRLKTLTAINWDAFGDRPVLVGRLALLAMLLMVCTACEPPPSGGVGGSGSASSSVSSAKTSSAATSGGGGAPPVMIAPPQGCTGNRMIAPIDGEEPDENAVPLHEDGAISLRKMVPPHYPFHVTGWSYTIGEKTGTVCVDTAHEAVSFVGPAGQPPSAMPAGWMETPSSAVGLVNVPLDVVLMPGQALWIGVRQHITPAGRTCVIACQMLAPAADPVAWHSDTNAAGLVDACPAGPCAWEPLAVSPTQAAGLPLYDWRFTTTGF